MFPPRHSGSNNRNAIFWAVAGASSLVAATLILVRELRRSKHPHDDIDDDEDKEFALLFPTEQAFLELGLPPITSATVVEVVEGKDVVTLLRDRWVRILEANPWLAGRFEKRQGRVGIGYRRSWQCKTDSIDNYFAVKTDSIPYKGEILLNGRDYGVLAKSCIALGLPAKQNWKKPFVKVTCVPHTVSARHDVWIIFSLSHAVGDGDTYYSLLKMLLGNDPIQTLRVERLLDTAVEIQKRAMGTVEQAILGSPAHAISCIAGVLANQWVRVFGPKSAQIQTLLLRIDPEKIKTIKEEYQAANSADNNNDKSFISTNDIVTSWICSNCHCEHAFMAVNFRGKLEHHTPDLAGNYENVIYYRVAQDTSSPQLIRQSVQTLRRAVTADEQYSAWKLANQTHAIVTNWSSFWGNSCSDLKQWMHLPIYDTVSEIPRTVVIGVLFQERPDQLSLLLTGTPQKLQTLAMGAPFAKKVCLRETFEIVSGLDQVLDRYDGFLVDQWGVMHDGKNAFEGAVECISMLATKHNKTMVILSNSPSPYEEETLAALEPMGFDPKHFVAGAVTSGHLAVEYICKESSRVDRKLKVLIMAWKSSAAPPYTTFLKACGNAIEVVSDASQADMLIVQGNEILLSPNNDADDALDLGDFVLTGNTKGAIDKILGDCAHYSVPLLCIDPDLKVVNPDDSVFYMPGKIAQRYEEEFHGKCLYFGKPYHSMFQEGIRRLTRAGLSDMSRIAMIGDSLHHDVQGASTAGVDCIFLLGGVHRPQLGNAFGETVPRQRLEDFFESSGFPTPAIVVPKLQLSG